MKNNGFFEMENGDLYPDNSFGFFLAYEMQENDAIKTQYINDINAMPWYEMDDDEKQIAIETYDDWCCFEAEGMLMECKKNGFVDRHGIFILYVEKNDEI